LNINELIEAALKARDNAYAPYSRFAVVAALLTKSGKIYTGTNVENAAYSPSVCAERAAVIKAVAHGEREFAAIAVTGGNQGAAPEDYCMPCGVCRQTFAEFCGDDFQIIVAVSADNYKRFSLKELLPERFK
jgi:cytidine deaminase